MDSSHASGNSGAGDGLERAEGARRCPRARRRGAGVAARAVSRRRRARTSALVVDRGKRLHGCRGNRLPELVAPLEGVARRFPVAEPVVPAGDVATAAGEEEAFRARARPFDGVAQRAGEVRVPEERVTAHQRRVTGEARHHRERRAVGTVDRKHADRGVDGAFRHDPVDGDSRRRAGACTDARRFTRAPGGVDDSGDRLRQKLDVVGERRRVLEPDDAAAAREARRAVVVRRVDEHRVRRNPGQLLHPRAHRGGQVGAGEDEVDRHDRDRGGAVVENERLGAQRVVDAFCEPGAGCPAAVGQAAGRRDVGACHAGLEVVHQVVTPSHSRVVSSS